MPSLIDRRLHAAIETKQHETLLRVEGVADKAAAIALRAGRDALQLIMDGSVVHRNQREAADALKGIFPAVAALLDQQFRRLHYWSYDETVRVLAKQIPRRWFRKAVPDVVTVGEAAIAGTDIWADMDTEPVAGKRLSDADWSDFLKQHLFPPPSREQVERAVYAPVAGLNWQQRLDVLSHKITDMDRLAGILVTGASSGMSQTELKRQIQPVVQNISSSAARIARTEGLRIATSAQREQYAELGDMLAGVQIVATLDENTRPHHAARNGRIYWVDRRKKPTIDELPQLPDEPNCRCYDTPVLHPPEEFENDPQLRAEFQDAAGNAIPDPQVYSQWFQQVDVGRRKMAVGVKRYNAVAKKLGRTPQFTDFIGTDGALLPIGRLQNESPSSRELRLSAVSQQMLHRQELLTKVSRFGFVSGNDIGLPLSPFFKGQKADVSKALNLQGTKKQQEIIKATLGIIDAIHGDGDLPEIPLGWSKSTKWNGAMKFSINRLSGEMTATSISVSTISPHPHMTAAHEIGHFLDQQGIGSKRFASVDPKFSLLFKAFNDAIANSDSFQVIQKLATLNLSHKTKEHLAYIQRPEELFARAYAQWVATKSKNKTFAKELDAALPKSGTIPHQWSHDDFRPIAASLDAMFRELGWLK